MVLALAVVGSGSAAEGGARGPEVPERLVYLEENFLRDGSRERAFEILREAARFGFTGLALADEKFGFWWKLEDGDRGKWLGNASAVREEAARLGLRVALVGLKFGHSGSLLFHDPDLAEGLPVRDARFVRRGDRLVPLPVGGIRGGDFEVAEGDRVVGAAWQDEPGRVTWIDSERSAEGARSLRLESGAGHARIAFRSEVPPFQQFRLRLRWRSEGLGARGPRVRIEGGEDGRLLADEEAEGGAGEGDGWAQWVVAFNSLANERVEIAVGLWNDGAEDPESSGKLWLDGLELETVPTLNVLRRPGLPVRWVAEDGTPRDEGRDVALLADPSLGRIPYPGSYDVVHGAPVPAVPEGSRLREGELVTGSWFHALPYRGGQVGASLTDEAVFRLAAEELRRNGEAFAPDALFLGHDEIRVAGWEPLEGDAAAGRRLAWNVAVCRNLCRELLPGRTVWVWSDMFDPGHNAVERYDLVRDSLAGSWEGLESDVVIVNWNRDAPADSLRFFHERGHRQIVGAFYDSDVEEDHRRWTEALRGVGGPVGVMYVTWRGDHSRLGEFARRWWGE
jgi:hypothetical protein